MSGSRAGLYLHVPFCARVCPYCDFAVRTGDRERRRRYVDHLLLEIERQRPFAAPFDTIYFGGGTPSCMEPDDLARIVAATREQFPFSADTRLFLEANPEDVNAASLRAWRDLGVHTLSLGVQALDAGTLAFLGRAHGPDEARRAVGLAREEAFPTVSIDLIYGLPGQTARDWRQELDRALALSPDHVSCYQLTVHAGTRFGAREKRGTLRQLPNDAQGELFRLTHEHLGAAGMPGYEVSQFARSVEHRSRHNQKYWDHTPYLGLGPSAHSFDGRRRWWNLRPTGRWEERIDAGEPPVEETETLDGPTLALEALMTGLRTYAGVDLGRVRALSGLDLRPRNAELIDRLVDEGRVSAAGERIVPTLEGLAVADSLAALFDIPAAPAAEAPSETSRDEIRETTGGRPEATTGLPARDPGTSPSR